MKRNSNSSNGGGGPNAQKKEVYTRDVLVQAVNSTHALQVAKQVHRGYTVDHVTPSGITFWKG
jgi:hypothetical protein